MLPKRCLTVVFLLALLAGALLAPSAAAQRTSDPPTAYSPKEEPRPEEATGGRRVLEAICWYLPNRVVDLADIFRVYLTLGDGLGITVRATKLLWASWFEDDAYGIGWLPRKPPIFGENINEKYFGFLFASQGKLREDPDVTEVGLSLHFIFLGANLAVSLGEAVDAVAGVVGLDLMEDDHGPTLFQSKGLEDADAPNQEPAEAWADAP